MESIFLLLIPIPVIGTVVRYRATYYPKSKHGLVGDAEIALPPTPTNINMPLPTAEGDVAQLEAAAAGPKMDIVQLAIAEDRTNASANQVPELTQPPTFFRVMKSVWREEKIEGTFKGIFPGLFLSLCFLRFYVSPGPATYQYSHYSVFLWNMLYIPYLVATYRIIVSQHKLHLWAPKTIYRNTFSEYERHHPFRAIQHSTLILPFLAVLCIDFFIVRNLRDALGNVGGLTSDFEVEDGMKWTEIVKLAYQHIVWKEVARALGFPLLAAGMAVVMAPVDVIVTRLAIQPVHGPAQPEPVGERDFEKTVAPPSYLHLTTEQKPYRNFLDCFQRIVKEEGWGVLYRSWFLTFLGYLHPILR